MVWFEVDFWFGIVCGLLDCVCGVWVGVLSFVGVVVVLLVVGCWWLGLGFVGFV